MKRSIKWTVGCVVNDVWLHIENASLIIPLQTQTDGSTHYIDQMQIVRLTLTEWVLVDKLDMWTRLQNGVGRIFHLN